MRPRKMSLQLTPLLDLLLIVIFAQYLEVQETQVVIEENAATAVEQRDVAIAKLEQQKLEVQHIQNDLEATLEQDQVVAKLLQELFEIPEQEIDQILANRQPPGSRTTADSERLKERFRQLAVEQSGRVVAHLLTYEEILKRCDLWEVHVTPDNFLTLSSGSQTLQMQVPIDIQKDFVQQDFIDHFIELAHTLPEPKSLAIAILTYDRRSQRWAVQGIRETLPQITLRLNRESAQRTRYDYADLGFRVE